jgi:hypothetical protein
MTGELELVFLLMMWSATFYAFIIAARYMDRF